MILYTKRLILRPWTEDDAGSLFEYAKDERIGPAAGWPAHKSIDDSLDFIRSVKDAPEMYAVCLREDNRAIGAAGTKLGEVSKLKLPDNEGEIGYWIGAPFWGRGLIPEAVRELIRRSFTELGLDTLWCGYFEGNMKSKRAMEKCGFTYHHTNRDIDWEPMGDVRTEHITRLTREEWESMRDNDGE